MPTLAVEGFSCIQAATMEVKPITILIGPQASGKSILTKLLYFCTNIIDDQYDSASDSNNIRLFKRQISRQFSEWFPPIAWGVHPFKITYKAGPIEFIITRRRTSKRTYDEIVVEFSKFFEDHYNELCESYRQLSKKTDEEDEFSFRAFDRTFRVRSGSAKALRQSMSAEFVESQLFIPAGRSFFTNLGKAVAMLEYGSQLDELTKRFGRLFTNLLDGNRYYFGDKPTPRSKEFLDYQKNVLKMIFGGEIKLSQNDKHVNTPDGRKIPLSVLSSGQQELLPLLLILEFYTKRRAFDRSSGIDLLYIEEPEAHLFPSSQALLIKHLAAISNFTRGSGRLVVTTHSPYVLSTLNTLVKAFAVAGLRNKSLQGKVEKIVPRLSWVAPSNLNAYALEGGLLTPIKDESGLIDGSYLDEISESISGAFMELLELEVGGD
jgi:AAA15 family ATPase/GTPase